MRKTNIKYPWGYLKNKEKLSDAKLQDIFSIGHKSGEMKIENFDKKNYKSQTNVINHPSFYKFAAVRNT